jgi:purine nucleoside phosphorylase
MAEELRTELINKGYQDAVIIAYKDGQRLETEEEIRVFAETFPDLLNMLK